MSTELPLKSHVPCRSNLISDWAILNDATSRKLQRLALHLQTSIEIEESCHLLESYHTIYRQNLIQLRRQGYRGKCPSPTTLQLQQIAQDLHRKTAQSYSFSQVMHQLQALAKKLRNR